MPTRFHICLALVAVLFLSACGDTPKEPPSEAPPVPQEQVEKDAPPAETYDNIASCFSDIAEGSKVTAQERNGHIEVTLKNTGMDPESEPAAWSDITRDFAAALLEAKPLAADYGCSDVFAQLKTDDGTILVSGFNGEVKFDYFNAPAESENLILGPGTYVVGTDISAGKYDCIAESGFGVLRGEVASAGPAGFVQTMGSSSSSIGGYSASVEGAQSYSNLTLADGDVIYIEMSLNVKFVQK